MASASSLPCEEQLLCSICLDVFTEPVSTPCGHNYCKTCITGYWASSDQAQCPLCKKKFRKRPQLQVNTAFRDMLEHFNSMRARGGDDILAKPEEVPCDICLVPKLKAQKTCLVCLASYCQPHMEPHQRVPNLKKHQLIDPVSNLEERVCKKHDKMFELFCREDQVCVCFMCLKDDHVTHEAVPVKHACTEKKVQLEYVIEEIKMMENAKSRSVKEFKCSLEQSMKESTKAIADVAEVFSALLVSLRRSQAELVEVIQGKQKVVKKMAEERLAQLEQEVADLGRRRSELEQILQTEDHLLLLQSWHSLSHSADPLDPLSHSTSPFTLHLSDFSYVGMVKKAVAQVEKTLSNEMEVLMHEVRFDGCEAAEQHVEVEGLMTDGFINEMWTPPQDKLMMIQQYDAVDVNLDSYTAHPRLVVSEDGKEMRFGVGPTSLYGRRFVCQPFALGKEGFSSGRFYYEVQVSGSKRWVLGVVKKSINRETFSFPSDEDGSWMFCGVSGQNGEEYYANTYSNCVLYLSKKPETIGVFVDYEKGEVSFYDVDTRTLMYSYTECIFTETIAPLKSFLYFMAGASLSSRPKLYPVLGIFKGDDNMLKITPVAHAT